MLLAGAHTASAQKVSPPEKPCPYDSAHFNWRKPVPRNRLRELRPDRPGITESPFTVDAGHAQLEVDAVRLYNIPATDTDPAERVWQASDALLKLGISRKTDVQVELPLYTAHGQRPAPGEHMAYQRGIGDMVVRLKHNFLGDDQKGPIAMAAVGYVRLPTAPAGVGNERAEYGLILPVNIELPDKFNLDMQLKSELSYDPDEAQRFVRLIPSVALDHEFTDHLALLAEAVFPWDTEQRRWQTQLNLAPIISLNDNFQFDFGTHLALNHLTNREYFVGFTVRR